jgi:hypothetical protein
MPIRLEMARAGMILASDVRDRRGRLLLPAGHETTPRALRIFRMWGVTELEVEGFHGAGLAEPEPPIPPARLEAARRRAEELFRQADRRHPLVAELFRLATLRLAREHADAP